MTEIIVGALRIAFLALLWLFILFIINVIRTDAIGQRVATDIESESVLEKPKKQRKTRRSRGRINDITITDGRSAGLVVPLVGPLIIGRNLDCGLPIDDDYSSGQHARLSQNEKGKWIIEDLLSTNGTYVNEQQITGPTKVGAKDDIRIGRTHFRLGSSK